MDQNIERLWNEISYSINSIKLILQNSDTQKMLANDRQFLTNSPRVRRTFDLLALETSKIVRHLDELEKLNATVRQERWDDPVKENTQESHTLGPFANVHFSSLGRSLKGKVDTGATTSSLHGEQVKIDKERRTVSFVCRELSNNVITIPVIATQEVHSADAGGELRPVVKFDIEIDNIPMKDVEFNINDRSNMDVPVLVGQNILKSGGFVVDVNATNVKENETLTPNTREQIPTIGEAKSAAMLILSFLNANDGTRPEPPSQDSI